MQSELITKIDGLMAKVWDDLKDAADKKDTGALFPLNGRMAELGKMKGEVQTIITRLQEMDESKIASGSSNGAGLRKIRIKVTQGMINQNLLTLTEARRRGIVSTGEKFSIESIPNHQRFTTFLERVGNKLQSRGYIADFYRSGSVQAGGIVEMIEVERGSWQLRPAEVGDFAA